MPAQLKELDRRIRSVKNTQQITRAMKMVAAAKLRRAQDKLMAARPYGEKLDAATLQAAQQFLVELVEIAFDLLTRPCQVGRPVAGSTFRS